LGSRAATLTTPTYSHQSGAKHFQQCTEFLPLRNRALGPFRIFSSNPRTNFRSAGSPSQLSYNRLCKAPPSLYLGQDYGMKSSRTPDYSKYPVIVSSKSIRPDLREWFQR
jgi:hypothetical protein